MAALRVFTAIKLPTALTQSIDKAIGRCLNHPSLRPVSQESLHITLNFIGDCEDRETPELCKALAATLKNLDPFEVTLKGIGAFPNFNRPRVLWIGVEKGSDQIVSINHKMRDVIEDLGFIQEKRYQPHLTLARVQNRELQEPVLNRIRSDFDSMTWPGFTVSNTVVFNSILEKAGPTYIPLATLRFDQ